MSTDPDTTSERTTDNTDVQERLDRLESLVETQQETIQQQRERIDELDGETDSDETPLLANRRTALKAGGLAALLFGGVGTASADPQGQVGTSSDPLKALYTDTLGAGSASEVTLSDTLDLDENDIEDSGTTIWDTATGYVPQDRLENDSLSVAGNSVSLGGSTSVDYADLGDTSSFPVPNGDLASDSVTVSPGNGLAGGGEVSLGGSTTLDIDTGGVGSDEIATSVVTDTELAGDSVRSSQIASGAVGSDEIATNAVGTDEINTGFATLATLFSDSPVKVGGNGELVTNDIVAASDQNDGRLSFQADETIRFNSESGGGTTLVFGVGTTIGSPLTPDSDGILNIGASSARWDTVYANSTNTTSDARLKQAITGFEGGLDRLSDLRPISYEWADRDDPDTRLGFVAQELEEAVPEAVSRPEEEDGYLGVEYDMLLPVAVDAIQTQQEHIDDLEDENADLREHNEELEARLERVEAELGINTTANRQGVADD